MKQFLHTNWKLRVGTWQDAVVPGTVYTDLLRMGKIPDPFFKDNEDAVCAKMKDEYVYESHFTAESDLLQSDKVELCFEGLDTVADIFLNDVLLGQSENMHRVWNYDVTQIIQTENCLRVMFHSPLDYIAKAHSQYGNIGNEDTYEGFMHLRKAHFMFGWDWGAHLPDAGIFRPVYLKGIKGASFDTVWIRQHHTANNVRICIQPEINTIIEADYHYEVQLTTPTRECLTFNNSPTEILLTNPQYWWPNGLGEQPLYNVKVLLLKADVCLDVWERKVGIRTLTMQRNKDEWGESFAHEINGMTVFAMGADYIPEDHLLGRRNKEKTRRLLEDCKEANFNSIRVWGGAFYPDDWFYEICDELGLLVWQDFMFACSVYELTPSFEANIRQEFIDNVKRIRHHACLALWCGNNEMEMFVDERCWVTKATEVRDYLLMYERIIPEILREYDPDTFYWPASPSSGGSFDAPNDPNRGDVHYWKVWHGNKPFTEYRKHYFRYASEFGFQAFPSVETLREITDDESDLNPFSYIMEKHQRNYGANGKIMNYMQQTYRYPTDFTTFVYASQLLQAEAIRYGVEHFRRNRERCMGAIYWQLNDCWPVISWSSIDYCGRWKALHYYAKRFFAPVMISCQEEGMMSAEANMNRQHFAFEKSIHLHVTNETRDEKCVMVSWEIRNAKAEISYHQEKEVLIPPLSGVWLPKEEFPEIDIFNEYVSFLCRDANGILISDGTAIFSYPKYFRYEDPNLAVRVEGEDVIVSAKAYAKSIEIQNADETLLLSDNYFDLNGDERRVKILRGNTQGLRVQSAFDIK